MARSRQEIISEMVDSGLFSDDEIKQAAMSAAPVATQRTMSGLTPISPRLPAKSAAELVQRLGRDTLEALPIPTSKDAAKRLLSPLPGQFGPSRTLQDLGEQTPNTQEAVGSVANKLSESKLGRLAPIPVAVAGAGAYALSHALPPRLTPSEAAASIGAEGVGLGIQALRPLAAGAGRAIARGAEGVSGLEYKTPGVLAAAANDPSLIVGPGRKAAGAAYSEISKAEAIRPSIGRATSAQQVIDEGIKAFDEGTITPSEALVVRQAVDKAKRSLPNHTFNNLRTIFDSVAKTVSANADKGYARAIMSDALRLPLPVNKSGGTSIAKGFLGTLAGVVPALSMSPIIQGGVATAAGISGRQVFGKTVPGLRAALSNSLRNRKEKSDASR